MGAEKLLEECGIAVARPGSWADRKGGSASFGKPLADELRDPCIRMAARAAGDLKERFGLHFGAWGAKLMLRCCDGQGAWGLSCAQSQALGFSSKLIAAGMPGGAAELGPEAVPEPGKGKGQRHWRLHACSRLGKAGGRGLLAFQDAIVRHEFGHLLCTDKQLERIGPFMGPARCKALFRKAVSGYGARNRSEAVAEVFSLVTDPEYRAGRLCAELEDMVAEMVRDYCL